MKNKLNIFLSSLSLLLLASCSNGASIDDVPKDNGDNSTQDNTNNDDQNKDNQDKNNQDNDDKNDDSDDESKNDEENNKDTSNIMIVYFSATNHTENVAKTIQKNLEAPIYKLEPVNPYTSEDLNYSNSNSRVVKEHLNENRHVELKTTSFEGFDEAKYVFLGAPVWWQELSWVVDDFVKLNDFSNKTIIPFATSVSSGFSTSKLESYTTNATWLAPQRFSSSASESSIISWLDGLNLN